LTLVQIDQAGGGAFRNQAIGLQDDGFLRPLVQGILPGCQVEEVVETLVASHEGGAAFRENRYRPTRGVLGRGGRGIGVGPDDQGGTAGLREAQTGCDSPGEQDFDPGRPLSQAVGREQPA